VSDNCKPTSARRVTVLLSLQANNFPTSDQRASDSTCRQYRSTWHVRLWLSFSPHSFLASSSRMMSVLKKCECARELTLTLTLTHTHTHTHTHARARAPTHARTHTRSWRCSTQSAGRPRERESTMRGNRWLCTNPCCERARRGAGEARGSDTRAHTIPTWKEFGGVQRAASKEGACRFGKANEWKGST
jgi:hypothetical protein